LTQGTRHKAQGTRHKAQLVDYVNVMRGIIDTIATVTEIPHH